MQSSQSAEASGFSSEGSCDHSTDIPSCAVNITEDEEHDDGEEEALIQMVECRICQDEDSIINLEAPCVCSGKLQFAHRKCVQRWCNEKGDTVCEICNHEAAALSASDVAFMLQAGQHRGLQVTVAT